MKISCVLPVYNTDYQLSETIETLVNQSYDQKEIIVIDDGSTDEIQPLKEYWAKEKEINWITNPERKGAAFCRNLGNNEATGDVIAVCDAGDLYTQNRLSEIQKFFEKDPEADIFYSDVQINSTMKTPIGIQKAESWEGESKPPISHPTVAYRKKVTKDIKYNEESFDTDFYEFFLIDAFRNGSKFGFINKILCVKLDLTTASDARNVKRAKQLKKEMYKRYGIEVEYP